MSMDFEKIDLFAEEPKPKEEKKPGPVKRLVSWGYNKAKDALTGGGSSGKSQDIKTTKSESGENKYNNEDDMMKIQEALKNSNKKDEHKDDEIAEIEEQHDEITDDVNPILKQKTMSAKISQATNESDDEENNKLATQSFGSLANSFYDMIYQTQPIEKTVTDIRESLQLVPASKYDEIVDIYAEQLALATDKEGNKLFSSVSDAKKFIDALRNKKTSKYTLPKAIVNEIKEKRHKRLTPMIKKELKNIHHDRVMYQF